MITMIRINSVFNLQAHMINVNSYCQTFELEWNNDKIR